MPRLEIKSLPTRKKILPLVMTIANSIIKELRVVERINEAITWERSHWNISPGGLAKMLILGTFTDIRIPLTHIEDRFENIDTEYFLEATDKSSYVNEFNVGEALERLGAIDSEGLYESIALTAMQTYKIPIERMHSDTTTLSFYGEYDAEKLEMSEEEREALLRIEQGYNKDGRRGCNQVVVGQITNELGIPITSKIQDGSTSDIEWNREAIKYIERMRQEGFSTGIYVADSKLMTEEHVKSMNAEESRIDFVSRCPANFCEKLEERIIEAAYTRGNFEPYENYSNAKEAAAYRGAGFTEEVYGAPLRLIVLESNTLQEKANRTIEKKKEALQPLIKELSRKSFKCMADAEIERDCFTNLRQTKLFSFDIEIEERQTEKWPRGRRNAQTKPVINTSYHVRIKETTYNELEYQRFIRNESCIVIASNATHMSDEDIVKAYKGQHVVENSFRSLKSPQLASVIYLKSPVRIKALSMVLTLSLLIRALIQYRLRSGLEAFNESRPGEVIHAGWSGRPLENPTFKLLYEHSINCCFERESFYQYSFAWPSYETKSRVSPLLDLMGLTLERLVE